MSQPVSIDIPHQLGHAEARRRVETQFGRLSGFIPGGRVTEHLWQGDTLHFTVEGMGQRIASRLTVMADKVHAEVDLPPFLALFAEKFRGKLADEGAKLLK